MLQDSTTCERPDLDTDRLLLRRPAERDVASIIAIVGNWDVARRLSRVPHLYGTADARFFLDQIVPVEWVWAIALRGDDSLIGMVGLTPDRQARSAELGYWLSPDHWGRGIATEAAAKVAAFGFEEIGLPRLTSGFFLDNPASGQVLRKLGFVEAGKAMLPGLAVNGEVPGVQMQLVPAPKQIDPGRSN